MRRYNTIILPSGNPDLSDYAKKMLIDWVKQGGTLIAHNNSTRTITNMDEFGNVKHLTQTFDNSNDYQIDLMREIYSKYEKIDISDLDNGVVNYNLSYPWENSNTKLSKDDLEKRDKWQSLLMPSGAIVAARVDTSHWLTFGTENTMPVLYSNFPILMTGSNSQAILRIGELTPNEKVTELSLIHI